MSSQFNTCFWLFAVSLSFRCSISLATNVALWSQTSPEYTPLSNNIRDQLAIWPPEVASHLTYHLNTKGPAEMATKLGEVLSYAMSVWESAANITFVPVNDQRAARIIVNMEYYDRKGHYHGGGNAWPPIRRSNGTFETSYLNLFFGGEPDQSDVWYEDSWVWTTVHELGHTLGLWHEFQRSDRAKYVRVLPGENLLPIMQNERGHTADTYFDYASVMMYSWTDNDRNPYFYLVTPSTASIPLPTVNFYRRNGLSVGDVWIIQWLYGKSLDREPMIHQNPCRDDTPLVAWQEAGWTVMDAPGTDIYGCDGWVVMEAEYGFFDHWTSGGNPARLEKSIDPQAFQMSVEVKAEYVPIGTQAGVFVVLSPNDWIYFGPYQSPREVCAQRTGRPLGSVVNVNSNFFRLRVTYQSGRLELSCIQQANMYPAATFTGLAAPVRLGIGIKTWGEFGYRRVHFRNPSVSPLN